MLCTVLQIHHLVKVRYPKYYKKQAYVLAHKLSTLWSQNGQFSHFYDNQLISAITTVQCTESLILYTVLFVFMKKWKKKLLKAVQICPKNRIWFSIVLGIYNFALETYEWIETTPMSEGRLHAGSVQILEGGKIFQS